MLEKEVMLISNLFSSVDEGVTFMDEMFTASSCIDSGVSTVFFFPDTAAEQNRY